MIMAPGVRAAMVASPWVWIENARATQLVGSRLGFTGVAALPIARGGREWEPAGMRRWGIFVVVLVRDPMPQEAPNVCRRR
jgi:hypothetical protein